MSESPSIYLEKCPPTLCTFMAFTESHDMDAALQAYQNRYGQPPANIIHWKRGLYLGPVPEQTKENLK